MGATGGLPASVFVAGCQRQSKTLAGKLPVAPGYDGRMVLPRISLVLTLLLLPAPALADAPPRAEVTWVAAAAAREGPAARPAFLLHFPGIGGTRGIDRTLVAGLFDGGVATRAAIFDWTEGQDGLDALAALDRNKIEAQAAADLIVRQRRRQPGVPIIVTSHSGGAGPAVWALEDLPPGVTVDALVLLAPALSPGYDLSPALKHVSGRAYAVTSPLDKLVLGTGTEVFGTIDRVNTAAAGDVGFLRPEPDGTAVARPSTRPMGLAKDAPLPTRVVQFADPVQYDKLTDVPYRPAWRRVGNNGTHLGPMMPVFVRRVLAPMVETGKVPAVGGNAK